ncbi:MAG TPA: DNA-processing protein DprA [Ktedonobacterales bacterium]|jgi:DNA processing protein
MNDEELAHWLVFTRVRGIGPARFQKLLDFFGDAATAWRGGQDDLLAAGLDARTTQSLLAQRKATPDALRELELLARHNITALPLPDPAYPALLREIYLPPSLLYLRGTLTAADEWAISIVGTRKATAYGLQATNKLAGDLAQQQITIISGLARGIDTAAHQAALTAGGRTIAVLGCGLDIVYPPENAKLAARIVEQGALVSEFPLGTKPEASNFPARNRIISGLSRGVLVIEAPLNPPSGALITTRFALDQNRDVFALPGSIFSRASDGTNKLIQDGAKLVMQATDILEDLQMQQAPQQQAMREHLPASNTEGVILALLAAAPEPLHSDEICRATGLPASEVSGALLMMHLKGMIVDLGSMRYARVR